MADETKTQHVGSGPSAMPPVSPSKPGAAAVKPAAKPGKTRRNFLLSWFAIAWVSFALGIIGMILGTIRFLFPNVLAEPPSTFKAGLPDQYEEGQVVERFKQDFGVWVVRLNKQIFALSTTCTHLGCTPNWLEAEQKFKCPCHGSGFQKDGTNFEGPAPRPLERYKIGLADDGQILIDKTEKFQKELGQWSKPNAAINL